MAPDNPLREIIPAAVDAAHDRLPEPSFCNTVLIPPWVDGIITVYGVVIGAACHPNEPLVDPFRDKAPVDNKENLVTPEIPKSTSCAD